ncbi:MAG: 30S ribosomal protein S8 [Patescibacteria group bacterium]|nr:30S ribosomal protein S8 [Patescibacteria group bacterium]
MDTISDFLTKIRNANQIRKPQLRDTYSQIRIALAKILLKEGYLTGVDKIKDEEGEFLILDLKYNEQEEPVIHSIKTLSSPGRHLYVKNRDIPRVKPLAGYKSALGIIILSTSRGIMTGEEARKKNLGGELIAEIY